MQLDTNSTVLIALGIIAIVAIVYAIRYGGSGKTKVSGPFGMGVEAEGRNPAKRTTKEPKQPSASSSTAVDLEDIKAGGGVYADAEGNIKMKKVDAGDDVIANSKQPSKGDNAPKA